MVTQTLGDNVDFKVLEKEKEKVPFARKELVPHKLNISMLTSMAVGQEISVKGKVVTLKRPKHARNNSKPLTKAEAWIVDTYGSIKIVLWEDDISKVENGSTYNFQNLRIRKTPEVG